MIATITVPQLQVLNRSGKANNVNSVFVVGELQTLSYSIHTQDMPVRSFGRKGPKAFTSGPRTIAGSLVFSTFDRHVFRNISEELIKHYSFEDGAVIAERILSDEMPPLNITVTFANEYGNSSLLAIYGVHIQDEGQVMSLDDIMTETTMSYFALDIIPLKQGNFKARKLNLADPETQVIGSGSAKKVENKVGDFYVRGSIRDTDGKAFTASIYQDCLVRFTDTDGTVRMKSPDFTGRFFVEAIDKPDAVDLIYKNTVIYTKSDGIGHDWSMTLPSIP
jgi:hypothetical protein